MAQNVASTPTGELTSPKFERLLEQFATSRALYKAELDLLFDKKAPIPDVESVKDRWEPELSLLYTQLVEELKRIEG